MAVNSEQSTDDLHLTTPIELPPNPNLMREYNPEQLRHIVFAGGNFWGVEAFLARIPGVAKAETGYVNGFGKNLTLAKVLHGDLGHALAVRVSYDPRILSLRRLLDLFFTIIDPTTLNHQGHDWGTAYRTGVYYEDKEDYAEIEAAFDRLRSHSPERIMVEFEAVKSFQKAEPAQQQYLEKNPDAYCPISFETLPQYKEINDNDNFSQE